MQSSNDLAKVLNWTRGMQGGDLLSAGCQCLWLPKHSEQGLSSLCGSPEVAKCPGTFLGVSREQGHLEELLGVWVVSCPKSQEAPPFLPVGPV